MAELDTSQSPPLPPRTGTPGTRPAAATSAAESSRLSLPVLAETMQNGGDSPPLSPSSLKRAPPLSAAAARAARGTSALPLLLHAQLDAAVEDTVGLSPEGTSHNHDDEGHEEDEEQDDGTAQAHADGLGDDGAPGAHGSDGEHTHVQAEQAVAVVLPAARVADGEGGYAAAEGVAGAGGEGDGDAVFRRTSSPAPRRNETETVHWERRRSSESDDESALPPVRHRRRCARDPNKTPTTSDGEDEGISSAPVTSFRRVGRVTPIKRQEGEISLLVGGRRFIVEDTLFDHQSDTMLGRMFGSGRRSELTKPNDNGDYVIEHDVTPEAFAAILKYYREGKIKCPPTVAVAELHDACRYFMVPFTHTSVQCEDLGKLLHELSNTGAAAQFETFMLRSLVPAMARCAELGERSCHIAVLSETDTVEWDDDLPPTLGEQFAKVVHDSSLSRFLYSYENRNIAKKLLKEKGLKKIKIGIEGFPTFAERVKRGINGEKLEVEYHYDQRPFIKASWEKEESKSRHVDFHCCQGSRKC